ncbi:hypothetical protein BH09BAC6_BH09BAC6_11760 [soil metagenome]|jgi:glycosyltransferase involved in cell wall biosynthesis
MNFVFVNYDYSPNFNSPRDWVNRIKAYTGSLECLGKENTVTRVEQINYEGDCSHNGVRYFFGKFGKRKNHLQWELNRFVEDLNADIVVVHGRDYALPVMQLRLLLNKKTKIIAHHSATERPTGIKKYLQKIADRYIDAYLFASSTIGMNLVNEGYMESAEKIHEVMEVSSAFYPVDKAEAKAETGATGSPVFLWVGRLTENKDPLNVIKAFLKFVHIMPGARLYMIYHSAELLGDIEAFLERQADKHAVVLILSVLSYNLLYWYNSADFIISGANYEGSGTSICEAMSCGCIPIVSDRPSFKKITDNGKCGILYEHGSEKALLMALMQTQVMNKQEKQNRSLDYFKKNLSFEAIAQQIKEVAVSLN